MSRMKEWAESEDIIGSGNEFDSSVDNLLKNINVKYHESFPNNKEMVLSLIAGSKFVKVIHDNSVWGFVAKVDGTHKGLPMAKGDILKAAGWRAPAKHSRGSIFDKEMHKSFSWTGPNYL